MAVSMRSASIPFIVSQFADNCASLWDERERVARARTYRSTLDDLHDADSRIEAQIDGLIVSGDEGWHAARSNASEFGGPGELFTAAAVALRSSQGPSGDNGRFETVLDAVAAPAASVRPLAVATHWVSPGDALSARLASKTDPFAIAVAVTSAAMRGVALVPHIERALESDCPWLVEAACGAVMLLRLERYRGAIEAHLLDADANSRYAATLTGLFLGSALARDAMVALVVRTAHAPISRDRAAAAFFRALQATEAASVHRDIFGKCAETRVSLKAAGAAGVRELMPGVLEQLASPVLGRVAGEAFTSMTGFRLSPQETMLRSGPTTASDDSSDHDVVLDPDEGLPWPRSGELGDWWCRHSDGFEPRTRYLDGIVVSDVALRRLVTRGSQSTRMAAAELLALRGSPWLDVYAPAFRQRDRLFRDDTWR